MSTLTPEETIKFKLEIVKTFGETAKGYIQIASAGLALPLLFTETIFGKNRAEHGLSSLPGSCSLYGAWGCFLISIACGLIYQWLSVRRVWDELHGLLENKTNRNQPGTRHTWWVLGPRKMNLSAFYGGMVLFFFLGACLFVLFARAVLHP
jgi:hypothetical protein